MMKILYTIAILMLGLFYFPVFSQNVHDSWDKNYYPLDFNDVLAYHDSVSQASLQREKPMTEFATGRYRFCIEYTAESRNLSDEKKELMQKIFEHFKVPAEYQALYNQEIAFIDDGKKYWFPVQDKVFPHFAKELQLGDQVYLYGGFFAKTQTNEGVQWIFINTEFKSNRCDEDYTPLEFPKILSKFEAHNKQTTDNQTLKEEYTYGKYSFCISYTGKSRAIPADRLKLIKQFVEHYNINSELINQYQHEIAFKTKAGKTFWFPVQSIVEPYFEKELKKGGQVFLMGIFLSYWAEKQDPVWIFLNADFNHIGCE